MTILITLMSLLFIHTSAFAVLPKELLEANCQDSKTRDLDFWSVRVNEEIDRLIQESHLKGVDLDILRNQLVTMSYLELSEKHPMGYVYAHASHHLGRLVRYPYWSKKKETPLSKKDVEMISGNLLGSAVRLFPATLSKKLMAHSLDLYKTLAPSLIAEAVCGKAHVQLMLVNHHESLLKEAYNTSDKLEFMKRFVTFEQTYLQKTMYSMPDIGIPGLIGMLDKMRFIPFNGERHTSFYEWCQTNKCRKTSQDLNLRVKFDQEVIASEFILTNWNPQKFKERAKSADIEQINNVIMKDFCDQRKLPVELCY